VPLGSEYSNANAKHLNWEGRAWLERSGQSQAEHTLGGTILPKSLAILWNVLQSPLGSALFPPISQSSSYAARYWREEVAGVVALGPLSKTGLGI